ncbi:MAG: FHA domain-containing protein [Bacteroidetes bacterium]|jgi:predicted component of type VI protein secretion system|nr:FHA domain-containing protein [Bacteroidota bacterium]
MPIKLQVVKEGAEGNDPADYLFEQDEITIGRGSDNDLTIPDQKVSKQHARILQDGGDYLLHDRDSKNHTFVAGARVGEDKPYLLKSGDVIKVGDFRVEFVPLFMPSSEQTAFADVGKDENPFEKHASQLASALKGLAETYTYAPSDKRDDELDRAMSGALSGAQPEDQVVRMLLAQMGVEAGGDGAAATTDETPTPDGRGGTPEYVNEVVDMLLESVARMISIPTHFWREFSGNTVVQPPEKSFLHRADIDSLREHVLDPDIGDAEREKRLDHLREAVNTLVAHNVAMLAGYKKAAMKGSKDLLQRVNPSDAYDEARSGSGGFSNLFSGGGEGGKPVETLYKEWRELYSMEWGALEKELFRPTYIDAYLDRMARAWDVEKSDIVQGR